MTNYEDILIRLRYADMVYHPLCHEAANAIESLQARIDEMTKQQKVVDET